MDSEYEYAYSPAAGMLKILAVSANDGNNNMIIAGSNGGCMQTWTFGIGEAGVIGNTIYVDKPIVRPWQKG